MREKESEREREREREERAGSDSTPPSSCPGFFLVTQNMFETYIIIAKLDIYMSCNLGGSVGTFSDRRWSSLQSGSKGSLERKSRNRCVCGESVIFSVLMNWDFLVDLSYFNDACINLQSCIFSVSVKFFLQH